MKILITFMLATILILPTAPQTADAYTYGGYNDYDYDSYAEYLEENRHEVKYQEGEKMARIFLKKINKDCTGELKKAAKKKFDIYYKTGEILDDIEITKLNKFIKKCRQAKD